MKVEYQWYITRTTWITLINSIIKKTNKTNSPIKILDLKIVINAYLYLNTYIIQFVIMILEEVLMNSRFCDPSSQEHYPIIISKIIILLIYYDILTH